MSSWYETSVAPERLVDPSHPPGSKRGKSTLAVKARVANHHHHHHFLTCHAQQAHLALQDQKWATWQAAGMVVVVGMVEKAKAWKVHE